MTNQSARINYDPSVPGIFGFKREPYQFLSNMARVWVDFEERSYFSVEHAYQAAKTLDLRQRQALFSEPSPYQAKRIGSGLVVRQDWHQIKLRVMEDLLRQKFNTEPFKLKLKCTGDAYIEETNHWGDTYWGVCKGKGDNHLGELIMKIREELI